MFSVFQKLNPGCTEKFSVEIVSLRPPSTKALRMRHRWVGGGVCVCVCVGGGGGGTVIAHAHTNVFPPWLWRSGRHFPYGVWTPGHNKNDCFELSLSFHGLLQRADYHYRQFQSYRIDITLSISLRSVINSLSKW